MGEVTIWVQVNGAVEKVYVRESADVSDLKQAIIDQRKFRDLENAFASDFDLVLVRDGQPLEEGEPMKSRTKLISLVITENDTVVVVLDERMVSPRRRNVTNTDIFNVVKSYMSPMKKDIKYIKQAQFNRSNSSTRTDEQRYDAREITRIPLIQEFSDDREDILNNCYATYEMIFEEKEMYPESTVQEKWNDLMNKYADEYPDTLHYFDTSESPYHNKAKPDCSYIWYEYPKDDMNVAFLGELKKTQDSKSFQKKQKEHIIGFLLQWMTEQPFRKWMYGYLSDGVLFQLFKVIRKDGNYFEIFEYGISLVSGDKIDGLSVLTRLYSMTKTELGYLLEVPYFKAINGIPLVKSYLGSGSTSYVFSVIDPRNNREYCIKYSNNHQRLHDEFFLLKDIREYFKKETQVVPALVKPIGYVESKSSFLLLSPVGEKPIFHRSFLNLVITLENIHKSGYVHRDIRPQNLIFQDSRLLFIDFSTACRVNELKNYEGTFSYASHAILEIWSTDNFEVVFEPAYDLCSLVKTCWALYRNQIESLQTKDYTTSILWKHFWDENLVGPWEEMIEYARDCNYDGVISLISYLTGEGNK